MIPEEVQQYETVAMQNQAYDSLAAMGRAGDRDAVHVEAPVFKTPISCSNTNVAEGQPSRFVGAVASKDSIQVDWFRDGKPIVIGKGAILKSGHSLPGHSSPLYQPACSTCRAF